MKNVWKGMVLGTLSGAGVGMILDGLQGAGRRGADLSRHASSTVREAADEGAAKLKEAHLPERAKDLADHSVAKLKEADLPDKARELVDEGAAKLRDAEDLVSAKARGLADRN